MTKVAIVGAGFSGTLLALHLLRRCSPSTEVVLIERNARFGRGAAYSTGNPSHLLNVPAGKMSAFHDKPHDFLDWLLAQQAPGEAACGEGSFVSRGLYGNYIRQLIRSEMRRPENKNRLRLIRGEVTSLVETEAGLTLNLDRKSPLQVDFLSLAVGNFPPEAPRGSTAEFLCSQCYHPDPWSPGATENLDPEAAILLIGTGLTTVDTIITLLDNGHRGPIHALSRRGLLPLRHAPSPAFAARRFSYPTRLTALLHCLREEAERAFQEGATWHPVIDEMRPFTQDLWQSMAAEDRERFMRHLRPWWDIHRHRMAPAVADRIDEARAQGKVQIHAAKIAAVHCDGAESQITYRPRFSEETRILDVARVINCSGPGCDYDRIEHLLVRELLSSGMARPEALALGLDVTAHCALRRSDGSISSRLFAVGPVTKGRFWEMTAVPDIRRQCELLAAHMATMIKPPQPVKSARLVASESLVPV